MPFSNDEDETGASLTSSSMKRNATGSTRTKNCDRDTNTKETKNGVGLSVRKRRQNTTTKKNKRAKGTAPDAVTCINTYFCAINVIPYSTNDIIILVRMTMHMYFS